MEFKEQQLKNIFEINPRMTLKKGTVTKKIAMEHLTEYVKQVKGYELSEFKSGSKFKNKDTLVARITPCLENGKTAYVDILADDEVAFGSTEFFVVRAKENKGDPQFIYYLMRHPKVRDATIKSMTGTSGRQRAQKEAILEYSMSLPNIFDQKKIGYFLSLFDSKIEANNDTIHNLEQLSQTLFKHWFIDFEFPNEEGKPYKSSGGEMVESELGEIPKLFKWKLLNEICEVKDGTHDSPKQVDVGYPLVTSKHLKNNEIEFNTTKLISETDFIKVNKRSLVEYKDILISMIGTVGRLYFVQEKNINYAIKNIGLIKSSQTDFSEYIYMYFKSPSMINYIKERMTGSTQQYISLTELRKIPILRPNKEIIDLYLEKSSVNFDMIHNLILENQNLQQLRDTLLPKLLSGEIKIPDELEV